jgi:hypothetical protein
VDFVGCSFFFCGGKVAILRIKKFMEKNDAGFNEDNEDVEESADNVDIERAMIVCANTVIDPWTMMVKSFNAVVANVAVATPFCSDDFTFGA